LKQTIWGGDRIIPFKHLEEKLDNVGESWEISGVKGNETIVSGGEYDGRSLNSLVEEYKGELVGEENYKRFGNEFPLLIKFIDARQDLSIQVHPTDEKARAMGYDRGKTEMWYIMDSSPEAKLRSGMAASITPEQYKQMVTDNTICDAIKEYSVKEGDCFFLPAGRVHSIGAGCFLAEIQQTSDVTFRIYDFNRRDKNGNLRQLHLKEASECIDYNVSSNYRTIYVPQKDQGISLVRCPYFNTSVYDLTEPMTIDYSELDSFVILIAVKGGGTITVDGNYSKDFLQGDTILLPATTKNVDVKGNVKFLETYI